MQGHTTWKASVWQNALQGKLSLYKPWGFQEFEALRLQDKLARLSALATGRLYPQEIFLVLISGKRLSRHHGHSAAGRMKVEGNLHPIKDHEDPEGK